MMSSSGSLGPSPSKSSSTDVTTRPQSLQPSSLSSSQSLSSSTQDYSPTSTPRSPSDLSTSLTSSIDQSVLPSTLTQFYATNTGVPLSGGFFGSRTAVASTFTVVGILLFILLMIFGCCRRNQKNLQLQARARERRAHLRHKSSAVRRQDSRRKKSPHGVVGERMLEYMEKGFVTKALTKRQSNVGDGTFYGVKEPQLAGAAPEFAVDDGNAAKPLDRQAYQQNSQPPLREECLPTVIHSPTITPPRAHVPFHSWRLSRPPSYRSIHPIILTMEGDDDSIYQLPIHTSIETTAVQNQSSDDSSPRNPGSCAVPVNPETYLTIPPDLRDGQGHRSISPMDPLCDRSSHPRPPPIPPRSPLRRAMSMRTMLNVQVRESKVG